MLRYVATLFLIEDASFRPLIEDDGYYDANVSNEMLKSFVGNPQRDLDAIRGYID